MNDNHFSKIKWACRRGMLELDLILNQYLACYEALPSEEKATFQELLNLSDPELADLLFGGACASTALQGKLIEKIKVYAKKRISS